MERILEVQGEGGAIIFAKFENQYFFTSQEIIFEDEFNIEDLLSKSELFSDFYAGMIGLLKKYPVFNLYPEYLNKQYATTVKIYYDNFLLYNCEDDYWGKGEWEKALGISNK